MAAIPLSRSLVFNHDAISRFAYRSLRYFTTRNSDHGREPPKTRNTKVNFSLPNSEGKTAEETATSAATKLPPPYDPFSKRPAIEEPDDPKNLQEVLHRMRSEGLTSHAVKMFDGLSRDDRTHEAFHLFSQIKDHGDMPDVVSHTAVIEPYVNAGGHSKEALKVFMRMLASKFEPNAYTYAVVIKGLADGRKLAEIKRYVMEMVGKDMMPNPGTCAAALEAFVLERKEDEGRELLEEMKRRGFELDEKGVREVLRNRQGPLVRPVMSILFGR